jgi:hypothetical protein
VTELTIRCISCGQDWSVRKAFNLYEQQSVESYPCPQCGAYTLCCDAPADEGPSRESLRPAALTWR